MSDLISNVCLVGDRFEGFARHDFVETLSGFLHAVNNGAYDNMEGPLFLVPGQGIGEYELSYVCDVLMRRGLMDKVLIQAAEAPLAGRAEARKHHADNVLIAGITRVTDTHFRAILRVHNDNELLLDHQTGQHVQGMVSVEACRQLCVAVTESYFASRWPDSRYRYMIHVMATRFENFLFPLDATLDYHVERADVAKPSRLAFGGYVEVHQGNQLCSRTEADFSALDARRIVAIESRRAAQAIKAMLGGTTDRTAAFSRGR